MHRDAGAIMATSTSPLTFRVKPEERRQIEACAISSGLTVSSYIRSRLLDKPQTAVVYRRSQLQRSVRHLIGQIGRTGNNMNQIAARLNSGQGMTGLDRQHHDEGIAALADMRALLIELLVQA